MEKRLNTKLEEYFKEFKDNVRQKIIECEMQDDPKRHPCLNIFMTTIDWY